MSQFLPIDQVIKYAKNAGVDFGFANPRTRLAYLTKLRLLPQAVRQKIGGRISGCYPIETINKLREIEELRDKGFSYGQIRVQMVTAPTLKASEARKWETIFPVITLLIGLVAGYLLAGGWLGEGKTRGNVGTINAESLPNDQYQQVLRLVTGDDQGAAGGGDRGIYILALPEKNLYKLGQVNLTELAH